MHYISTFWYPFTAFHVWNNALYAVLWHFTCILIGLHRIEGRERQGGRGPIFSEEQERAIVNMVLANNAIRLREIQTNILNDHTVFNNVHQVSLSTLGRILKKHHIQMKQLYRVPFERNSERVKDLRHEYAEVSNVHFSIVHCTQNLFTCKFRVGLYWTTQCCLFFREFCKWMLMQSRMNLSS